jgi:murein DD-endopeptidase MepM/ murein hydrolase activator NlpD
MRHLVLLSALVCALVAYGPPAPVYAESPPTHYLLGRPIPPSHTDRQALGYPYGSTRSGRSPIHHGIDLVNRLNTPVIAAADGIVFYAGSDATQPFGPQTNFYGNLVVLEHNLTAPEGGKLYTLYGHLEKSIVQAGQQVTRGQQIGAVGKTGIALWYHLHFEVRVGSPTDYNTARNPELWFPPAPGTGKLIGRMVDDEGGLAMGIRFVVTTPRTVMPHFTYADALKPPSDPLYGENFVVGDLAAGCYRLRVRNNRGGYAYDESFCIQAGETLLITVKLKPMNTK